MTPDETGATGRLLRDIIALLLLVVGTVGVNTVAFLVDPLAGVAALSTTAIVAGVALGQAR